MLPRGVPQVGCVRLSHKCCPPSGAPRFVLHGDPPRVSFEGVPCVVTQGFPPKVPKELSPMWCSPGGFSKGFPRRVPSGWSPSCGYAGGPRGLSSIGVPFGCPHVCPPGVPSWGSPRVSLRCGPAFVSRSGVLHGDLPRRVPKMWSPKKSTPWEGPPRRVFQSESRTGGSPWVFARIPLLDSPE